MLQHLSFIKKWLRRNFELLCWSTALILLFFLPENKSDSSLCLFSALGFGKCLGCGIGHAMHYALKLEFVQSFSHHPLGILAVIIIFNRIRQLIIQIVHP